MGTVVAVVNQKGGVGKTNISFHLSGALAEKKQKVLVIDMDQQAGLSSSFLNNLPASQLTIADLLIENNIPLPRVITPTSITNLDIIPSDMKLAGAEKKISKRPVPQTALLDRMKEVKEKYDWILIDCPPQLGFPSRLALVSADKVLIPLECQKLAVKGVIYAMNFVYEIRATDNPKLEIMGYVINKYSGRRRLESEFREILRKNFKNELFKTEVKDLVKYTEAVNYTLPITYYAPRSEEADVYRKLAEEVINHG